MAYLKRFLRFFRDLYVSVLFVPFWIWSVLYDVSVEQNTGWTWITNLAPVLRPLIFALGAFALWQYLEHLFEQKPTVRQDLSGFQVGNLWMLSIALFVMGVGALLQSAGVFWGAIFVGISELLIPLVVLWLLWYERKEPEERSKPESQGTSAPESV